MRDLWRQSRFRNAFLLRGVSIWVGVRFFAAWGKIADPNLVQEGFILLLVGALVIWDARRRNEDLFLANLGIPVVPIGVVGALGALPLELLAP